MRRLFVLSILLAACGRHGVQTSAPEPAGSEAHVATTAKVLVPPGAHACVSLVASKLPQGAACSVFDSPEDAFRHVLASKPRVLAIGEAHAQKGTEQLASTTKRFTDALLPIAAPLASDMVVELWAPNPRCMGEVAKVDAAQKQVTNAQASTNKNEYEALGVRAKALGVTPWLLRPSCDEFASLTDAGEGAVSEMLGLVRRLTTKRIRELLAKPSDAGPPRMVLAYGGLMHNDLSPPPSTRDFAFGSDLAAEAPYTELDLVVPEYVKDSPTWQALPWMAAWPAIAEELARDAGGRETHLLTLPSSGTARSFVLVFPPSR